MKNILNNLLNSCAVLSSSVLDDGRKHWAESIVNNNSYWKYSSMGFSNGTTAATVNDSGLAGNCTFLTDVNGSYESSNKAVYIHTVNYSDIGSEHIYSEAIIAKNKTESDHNSLARIVYDPITLNLSDHLQVTLKIAFP